MMPFELAKALEDKHLFVYPPDLDLNPPQSYLFVQDFLILLCAVAYCFCYLYYTKYTKRDRFLAGPIDLTFGNLAYEIYYPFVVTRCKLHAVGGLAWFLLDLRWQYVCFVYACPPERRRKWALRSLLNTIVLVGVFRVLGLCFPDEGEQATAYWTGWMLEFPVGWVSIMYLRKHGTKGHSLKIWFTRVLGALAALCVFTWRYLNVPRNWAYVVSWPSLALLTLTFIPEVVYPFVFLHTERKERTTVERAETGKGKTS